MTREVEVEPRGGPPEVSLVSGLESRPRWLQDMADEDDGPFWDDGRKLMG